MNVFEFRDNIIKDYERFTRSFANIRSDDIAAYVSQQYDAGRFWPSPYVQLNPNFVRGGSIDDMVDSGTLHPECKHIFRRDKDRVEGGDLMHLHKHQEEAIHVAQKGESYVLTTGTGSGKSLSYFIPIVDDVLKRKETGETDNRITAIVVYPMNALCNSQLSELEKFLEKGYENRGGPPVTFARYTGQDENEERQKIAANPPDILLTNYVMLELIITRQNDTDKAVVKRADGLRFLVMDELHTYRGRQGADVSMLIRRVRNRFNENLLCVGTSATMASEGGLADRNRVVAEFATKLFGARVQPENIIAETLTRITQKSTPTDQSSLAAAIQAGIDEDTSYDDLISNPIAAWVETRLGLEWKEEQWVRISEPLQLDEAIQALAEESEIPVSQCSEYLTSFLLRSFQAKSEQGHTLFAFRLHQFIAGAGDCYATLEAPGERFITVEGQEYQPGNRDKRLFNLAFCRQCGQEYFPVWAHLIQKKPDHFDPRELGERAHEESKDVQFGYFMPDETNLFDSEDIEGGVYPEDWIEPGSAPLKLKPHFRKYRPQQIQLTPLGAIGSGLQGWYIPGSLRFCLHSTCTYEGGGARRSELTPLSSLSTEGRSSATTVLTLSTLSYLMGESSDLSEEARKILGFTDNRQDAALQAGHFNDFIYTLLIRSALLAAIRSAPNGVLREDVLAQNVQAKLGLKTPEYASQVVKGPAARNTDATFRDVLGYRLFHDLRRGWRIANPNLEQLKLLEIRYEGLDDCCQDEEMWSEIPLLAATKPTARMQIAHSLLDEMRRGLCIKTQSLDFHYQEQIWTRSYQLLTEPWGIWDGELKQSANVMIPRPSRKQSGRGAHQFNIFNISHRSAFGRKLKRLSVWGDENPHFPERFDEDEYNQVIDHLLKTLQTYGLVESVESGGADPGYRLVASVIEWHSGDGEGGTPNDFFQSLYINLSEMLSEGDRLMHRLRAHEHTAQVEPQVREERESLFRSGELPVLFCSPTMELGVDISTLNTVYMRNVPPTAANYAQRSGRAGRAGQPALVLTYCTAKSPHDQYFFQTPTRMVSGVVSAPSIDLANEDLIRSHLHAVWLSETGCRLPDGVREALDLEQSASLPVREDLQENLSQEPPAQRATERVTAILSNLDEELTKEMAPWYGPNWTDSVISGAVLQFSASFDRWRSMFRAVLKQMDEAKTIQQNHAVTERERKEADLRYQEARNQYEILISNRPTLSSDFYTYRYLANQGFLPGYNFPRLPLVAYLPGRRDRNLRDTFLSRSRFLGISEFGPQSIIYHEGGTYRVRRAILGSRDEQSASATAALPVIRSRLCPACGYAHFDAEQDFERCVICNEKLNEGLWLRDLYRIDQVSTRRALRITSDEEERQRLGYEMITTLRYAQDNGRAMYVPVVYSESGEKLLEIRYGASARLWRINLGWRRRKDKSIHGFNIDVISGEWAKDEHAPQADIENDELAPGKQVQRIIPFVEDTKNCLVVLPLIAMDEKASTTFQYALKRGIESAFQLEGSELAVESLQTSSPGNSILLYEASEGGAGVLTRLARDPGAMRRVAIHAMELSHYSSRSGSWTDFDDLENTESNCEAGCYRCLLSYSNQMEHKLIDRQNPEILDLLCRLSRSESEVGEAGRTNQELIQELENLSTSTLEKEWLRFILEQDLRLPDRAQVLMEEFGTRADFSYSTVPAVIFIDGPHHESSDSKANDQAINNRLMDAGFTVVRFPRQKESWGEIVKEYGYVFRSSS